MRKLFFAVLALSLSVSVALAAGNHPMAGCGLAYMLFAQENDQGVQILATTTNNSFGFQSFGITSGTAGCTDSGVVAMNKERLLFAESNFTNLSMDFAAGQGEYAAAFASLLGCKAEAHPKFMRFAQKHYNVLIPRSETTPFELVETIESQIASDAELSKSCTL